LSGGGCEEVLQKEGVHVHEAKREDNFGARVGIEVVSPDEEEDGSAYEEDR